MSDQQDKNIEQVAEETAAAEEAVEESAALAEEDAPAAGKNATAASVSAPTPAPAPARGSSAIAWLALLLVLGLAGGGAWYAREQQRLDTDLAARLQQLESAGARDDASLYASVDTSMDELGARLRSELDTSVSQLDGALQELSGDSDRLVQQIENLQSQLAAQRSELDRYGANDRRSWLLAEAEYLLRLANQRLIMAGDTASAQALLGSADSILLELDDAGLHKVRAAIAADLAAVRAVPRVDVEGIYLRLGALVEQAGKLVIFQLPEGEEQLAAAPADDWRARLKRGYEAALAKLSSYIIIRRRDVPMQALMDPQWEGLVRQNLRMLLEQAQVALLSGNQALYRESLQRARHWVGEFFESDETAARAMSREITQLADLTVAVAVPDVTRSLAALDDVMRQRLPAAGGE